MLEKKTSKIVLFSIALISIALLWMLLSGTGTEDHIVAPTDLESVEMDIATVFNSPNSYAQLDRSEFENLEYVQTRSGAEDDPCISCHEATGVMGGVLFDWNNSAHARDDVSCINCHTADQTDPDAVSHNGHYISVVVSPLDCAKCHSEEVQEFDQSLHAFGSEYYELLFDKEKLPYLESQLEGGYITADGEELPHAATTRGCQACHGTNMTGTSVEDSTVWPNNGIGRINPDGSRGSCSSCHSRHTFSVEEARKPETCGQCHMGPDHPHIEMFMESKHGNIYSAEGDKWDWNDPDWNAGEDYRAPTCSACHMSQAPGVPTTHDVSSRLSWELESPISKRTDNTANSLGTPISDGSTWQVKQGRMKAVCNQCHSRTWTDNYYEQADAVVYLYNEQYTESKEVVDQLYEEELLTPESFDEEIEFKIYEMWHHEGRRARMGAFMMGPDYVQWHGFYDLLQDKVEIEHMAEELRLAHNTTATTQMGDVDVADLFGNYGFLGILTILIWIMGISGWAYILGSKHKARKKEKNTESDLLYKQK